MDIIPVINKVDLAPDLSTIEELESEIKKLLIEDSDILKVSARSGKGVPELLKRFATLKHPPSNRDKPFKAVLFDSWYESYRGVITLVSIIDGKLSPGDFIQSAATGNSYEVIKVGILTPVMTYTTSLYAGQVGFIISSMRNRKDAKIGDTFFVKDKPVEAVPGYKETKPMVFSGIYPSEPEQYESLKQAMEKLTLNDAGVTHQEENKYVH